MFSGRNTTNRGCGYSDMGQNQSFQAQPNQDIGDFVQVSSAENASGARPSDESPQRVKGITVVNPKPESSIRSSDPKAAPELVKLDRLPKFWPILKSTLDYEYPLESFEDGLSHDAVLSLCQNYQQHLSFVARTTANEQKSLASRMRDIEMFSAGMAQQLMRRHDKINKALPHLQRVSEISQSLENIRLLMDSCVPLMNRINNSLPEQHRLEHLTLHISSPTHVPRPSIRLSVHERPLAQQEEPGNTEEEEEEEEQQDDNEDVNEWGGDYS